MIHNEYILNKIEKKFAKKNFIVRVLGAYIILMLYLKYVWNGWNLLKLMYLDVYYVILDGKGNNWCILSGVGHVCMYCILYFFLFAKSLSYFLSWFMHIDVVCVYYVCLDCI